MTENRVPKGVPTGGQFATSTRGTATDVALAAPADPPAFVVEQAEPTTLKPGDQVRVRNTDQWAEIERVNASTNPNAPWTHVAECANGYIKGLSTGSPVDVVRADSNGIPALTPTIWHAKMEPGLYDSGDPERVEWCDSCGDYQGFSGTDPKPWERNPVRCHGCDDQAIDDYTSTQGVH